MKLHQELALMIIKPTLFYDIFLETGSCRRENEEWGSDFGALWVKWAHISPQDPTWKTRGDRFQLSSFILSLHLCDEAGSAWSYLLLIFYITFSFMKILFQHFSLLDNDALKHCCIRFIFFSSRLKADYPRRVTDLFKCVAFFATTKLICCEHLYMPFSYFFFIISFWR